MKTLVLFLVVSLSGCLAVEKQIKPEVSSEERIYRSNCGICHRLHPPDLYTYQELEKYIEKFGRGLSAEKFRKLSEYLKGAAKKVNKDDYVNNESK